MSKGRLLLLPEVAERLRISEASARWLRHKGELPPAARIGKLLVWTEESIEEYLTSKFEKASA